MSLRKTVSFRSQARRRSSSSVEYRARSAQRLQLCKPANAVVDQEVASPYNIRNDLIGHRRAGKWIVPPLQPGPIYPPWRQVACEKHCGHSAISWPCPRSPPETVRLAGRTRWLARAKLDRGVTEQHVLPMPRFGIKRLFADR